MLGYLLAVGGIIVGVSLFFLLGIYVFSSIGLYNLAVINGYYFIAKLAWVPFAKNYLIALMGMDKKGISDTGKKVFGVILVILSLIVYLFKVNYVVMAIYTIFFLYAYYCFYKRINPETAIIFAIISAFIPVFNCIYLFVKRYTLFYDDYNILG